MVDLVTTQSTHPIDCLFSEMHLVEPYPDGVVEVPDCIPGVAFFPGGAGLWGAEPGEPLPPMPTGGVMVLGHDFHSEAAFRASLKARTEVPDKPRKGYRTPATWVGLRRLFAELGIPLERCFFTNAYMGLRKGKAVMGRFPGASDAGYVDRCRQFLLRQIEAQRPSVIVTLGTWVPAFIAPLSKELDGWRDVASMQEIDRKGAVVSGVRFDGLPGLSCTVAAITHPSLRGPNVGRRRYKEADGHRAELELLHDALAAAGWTLPPLVPAKALSVRAGIIETYAQWTALSALRSGAPIKSRQDVYSALRSVDFDPLFDLERGAVAREEFDSWHQAAVEHLIAG
jgi:hypothetical protein